MDRWIRQSPVLATNACVSCDQALVSQIGIGILQKGGNAADAAIAMAAAVSILQPMQCGIGGDCNCIFFKASDKSVSSVYGSGPSAENLTLQKVKDAGFTIETIGDSSHGFFVTVPGAVAGMFNCIHHFGSGNLSMKEILAPAIKMAEEGVALPFKSADNWRKKFHVLKTSKFSDLHGSDNGPPSAGDVIFAPKLARCFKALATDGPEAFYTGEIARKIISKVQHAGGLLTLDDMKHHLDSSKATLPTTPLYIDFLQYRLWEMGPNTFGIVVLVALNILKRFDLKALGHNSAQYIHVLAEAIKIAFNDCWECLCDPDVTPLSYDKLLSDEYAANKRNSIHLERRNVNIAMKGCQFGGDTSYLTAVDSDGNACSFIFSIFSGFGSGNIPEDCGFVLHDRGKCFSLDKTSPNAFGPRKRSLHTIIPAILTDKVSGELMATFGVVGRWMQPQGHLQVLLNMLIFEMDPQAALDQPRFFVGSQGSHSEFTETLSLLNLEDGISAEVALTLREKGHHVKEFVSGSDREMFGRGHIIAKPCLWSKANTSKSQNVWWAGSDPRTDGSAVGY